MPETSQLEIAPNVYWVSRREGSLLERNIYLRIFPSKTKRINLVVDPGCPQDRPILDTRLGSLIGGMSRVSVVFINHQDPDVAYNANFLQQLNPNLVVLCSEDSWRLVRFYGLDEKKYRPVEGFKNLRVKLSTGHLLRFIPSPYCHFRGAVMLYDEETRVLFTGDLFGGLSFVPDLYADERYWEGMKTFHQIYMPDRKAIMLTVKSIRELTPPPKILAPQHGSLLKGKWIEYYLDKLESLPVGLNLLLDSRQKENYITAMNEAILELSRALGPQRFAKTAKRLRDDGSFTDIIKFSDKGVIDIKTDLQTGIELFVTGILDDYPEKVEHVRAAIVKVLLNHEIPLPEKLVIESEGLDNLFAP